MGLKGLINKLLYGDENPDANPERSQAVLDHREALFNDPDTPSYGNPAGKVTVVEFIDYR